VVDPVVYCHDVLRSCLLHYCMCSNGVCAVFIHFCLFTLYTVHISQYSSSCCKIYVMFTAVSSASLVMGCVSNDVLGNSVSRSVSVVYRDVARHGLGGLQPSRN